MDRGAAFLRGLGAFVIVFFFTRHKGAGIVERVVKLGYPSKSKFETVIRNHYDMEHSQPAEQFIKN